MSTVSDWVSALKKLAASAAPEEVARAAQSAPVPTFGTVRSLDPLRIALDSDPATTIPYAPACLEYPTRVGERVWVQTYGTEVVVVGVVKGPAPTRAMGAMYKTDGFQSPSGLITFDYAGAVTQGGMRAQGGGAGAGELSVPRTGWYQATGCGYMTGGVGINIFQVVEWFPVTGWTTRAMMVMQKASNDNDASNYFSAPVYLTAGTAVSLSVEGEVNIYGDAGKTGVFLQLTEINP